MFCGRVIAVFGNKESSKSGRIFRIKTVSSGVRVGYSVSFWKSSWLRY